MMLEQKLLLRLATHYHDQLKLLGAQYEQGGDAALRALDSFDQNRAQIDHCYQWLASDPMPAAERSYLRINYCLLAPNIIKMRLPPAEYMQRLRQALVDVRGVPQASHEAEAGLLLWYGDLQMTLGEYESARTTLEEGTELTRRYGLKTWQADFAFLLQHLALLQGQVSAVLKPDHRNEALPETTASVFNHAQALMLRHRFKEAIPLFESLLADARKTRNFANIAAALNSLGTIYVDQKDYDHALACANEQIALGKRLNDSKIISQGTLLHGTCCFYKLQYDEALVCFNQVLEMDTRLDDVRGIATAHQNIGNIHFMKDEYPEAVVHFNQAREIYVDLNAEPAVKAIDRLLGQCRVQTSAVMKALALNPLNPVTEYLFGSVFSRIRGAWQDWREQRSYK